MKLLGFIIIIVLVQVGLTLSLKAANTHFKAEDLQRFQKVFVDGLNSNDLQSVFYSSLNIQATDNSEKEKICKNLITSHTDSKLNDFEKDFYVIGAHKNIQCSNKLPQSVLDKISGSLSHESSSTQEIYYNVAASKRMGASIQSSVSDKLSKSIQAIVNKDDNLNTLAYGLCAANELGINIPSLNGKFTEALMMADEVDGKMLQFEGGLGVTSLIVTCGLKASKDKNLPSEDQILKFANYFMSRATVQSSKGVHILIEGLKALADMKSLAPITLALIGNGHISPEAAVLTISVTDLLGKPLSPSLLSVYAKITRDDKVIAEKVVFNVKSSDKTTYSVDLASLKLASGTYSLDITADSYKQVISFKVLQKIKVQDLEIGVGDPSSTGKKHPVNYPNKLQAILKADHTTEIVIKFNLVDEVTGKPITVHQAFVRFYNAQGNEVVFIAESDNSKAYKCDVDVGQKASDFNHNSGLYSIDVIIGDSSISNSLQWNIASIEFKYGGDSRSDQQTNTRSKLPEIIHQFRQPDKRPPRFVSDVFTALCFAPLILLFIFWGKLGISFSNSQFSISSIGFHIGFGSILGLFGLFWLKLNMFQTIRFLIPLAVITFLFGNSLLRRIASRK